MGGWTGLRGGMASAAGAALIVAAQPQEAAAQGAQQLERVEVTGSLARRIDAESALPMQVITKDDIRRSGATSVVDLFKKLPVIQGSLGNTSSLAGATFGYSNVSIHNFDDTRTLVLLNGHRVSSFGGQTLTGFAAAFDINALPLSAIERIEVLTDGASAMYGSDAIAGVVNVITRRDSTEGDVTLSYASPQGGAKEKQLSISKGFGSLRDDGFNVFMAYSHNHRSELNASQRPFARSSVLEFTANGQRYRNNQTSASSIPANVYDSSFSTISNPALLAGGACPAGDFRVTDGLGSDYCGNDYASQIQIYPEQQRDSFMTSLSIKPSADHTVFADVLLTRSRQITRTAAAPVFVNIEPGTALHDTYLAPYGFTDTGWAAYRLGDLGRRVSDDTSDFIDFAVGSKGRVQGWDYRAEFAHSESRVKSNIAGYVGGGAAASRIQSGALNPFVGVGQQSAAGLAALREIDYRGYWDGGVAKLDTVSLRGSRELAETPHGPIVLGAGVSLNRERFRSRPSAFAQGLLADPVLGTVAAPAGSGDLRSDESLPITPYATSRHSYGVFGEVVVPVFQGFELTGAMRRDHYSDFGATNNLKGSFRWTPSNQWLLRGSVGTSFHAPSGPQVNAPRQSYGLIGTHDCTPELQAQADRLGTQCKPDTLQYDMFAGGNQQLEPEKAVQASVGVRFEPSRAWSIGADLWHIKVTQALGQVSEEEAFANPGRYPQSWVVGGDFLAYLAANQNLGRQYSTGIDFDASGRVPTGWGELGSRLKLSYLVREKSQQQPDGPYYSAIGNFAELDHVSFRWVAHWATSLRQGDWVHTLTLNARSGYQDREEWVLPIDDAGNVTGPDEQIRLKVKRFITADWQSDWAVNQSWRLALGVLNLFDRDPPLSLASGGLNRGQQVGFDDRYYDPRGRTFYANVSYKF